MITTLKNTHCIYRSKNSTIYKQKANDSSLPVLVKTLSTAIPTIQQLSYLKNEYEILEGIEINGVRKVLYQTEIDAHPALVLEHVQGETLHQLLKRRVLSLENFLKIAISLSHTLGEVHQQQIIHRDLNSNNIIVHPETLQTTIIDFGIASRLNIKMSHLENLEVLHGTLHYISPEQTGRMNRLIDTRTDLYSLGVSFYQALTGQLPFEGQDALELVHAHIAKAPVPPADIDPEKVPKILSDMLMLLLAKNAENRYQSAFGLKHDLEQCLAQWQQNKTIQAFELRTKDHSGTFRLVEKLYGRTQELEKINSAFERVAQGNKELFLISGYSGIGKSALVNEIQQPIAQKQGIFVKGKYNKLQRDIPYNAIAQAFQEFCYYLLTQEEKVLQAWRQKIQQAVGSNGQVLIDLIPSLELIIGKQPEVGAVGALEAQNRFNRVIQDFIKEISTKQHPLVLFLDDLQWADAASFNLIKLLMTDEANQYFLMVGAYRDNEVEAMHPLTLCIEDFKKANVPIQEVHLRNLPREVVEEIIVDALNCKNHQNVSELTRLIFTKTLGNAFFSTQLLNNIYEEGALTFDFNQSVWSWDTAKISQLNISDNVVDLMSQKIEKLSPEAQKTLQLAACVGNYFDLRMVSLIQQTDIQQCLTHLLEAVASGLLTPLNDHYKFYQQQIEVEDTDLEVKFKFVHDRILQAAHTLLAASERQKVHLQIGQVLWSNLGSEALDAKLFDVLYHLNEAKTLISNPAERQQLVVLNLKGGKQAKKSNAYHSATDYFNTALQLIADFETQSALVAELYREKGESEYLSGDFHNADQSLNIALGHSQTKSEQAEVYVVKIGQLAGQGQYVEALGVSRKALQLFGVDLPELADQQAVEEATATEMMRYAENMDGKPIDSWMDLPLMENEEMVLCTQILSLSLDCAIIGVPQVLGLYITKLLNLSFQHGLSKYTAVGIAWFATVQASLKKYKDAYQYALLAKNMFESKTPNKSISAKIYLVYGYMVVFNEPFERCKEYQFEAYRLGLEVGDFSYAGYGAAIGLRYMYHTNLNEALKKSEEISLFFKKANNVPMEKVVAMYLGFVRNLKGATKAIDTLDYDTFSEREYQESFQDNGIILQVLYKRYKLLILCLFELYDHSDVPALLSELDTWLNALGRLDLFFAADYCLASGIIASQHYQAEKEDSTLDYLAILDRCITELKVLNDSYVHNFGHYYWLLMAEKENIAKNYWEVTNCYEKAIRLAEKNDHLQNAAFGCELFAKFWLKHNKEQSASFYLKKARTLYNLFGADAKTQALEKKFPKYFSKAYQELNPSTTTISRALQDTMTTSLSTRTGSSMLDLESILKASQTLSEEIKINHLIEKMLAIVIENTGAEKGYLMYNTSQGLLVKAWGDANTTEMVAEPYPVSEATHLPLSVVNFVARSQREIVLDNASGDKTYANDVHIKSHQIKSLLCYPVTRQNELSVVFYLENNLIEGAFTAERLKVLQALSSQIVISIENAALYENLEQKVTERTKELKRALKQIMDSIHYGQRIQNAILVSEKQLSEAFQDHFTLYLPKDVVSGDFYWMSRQQNSIILAVIDCTGHGIPGAFMSMIGNALLNEIVNEQKIHVPAQILGLLHQGVKRALKQDETENKDGMDGCLCHLQYEGNHISIRFSGAKRPLYYTSDNQLGDLKGARKSIGGWLGDADHVYTEHSILLKTGDILYLSTDGYSDTPNRKRKNFTEKKLKALLASVNHLPLPKQRTRLLNALNDYKGNSEQRDDITIVGVKL